MRNSLLMPTIVLALLVSGPLVAADDAEHRSRGLMMDDETMLALHESMADLRSDIEQVRDADSNDIKIRMMEKHMNAMVRQMDMMMDAMEGKPVRRHSHRKTK